MINMVHKEIRVVNVNSIKVEGEGLLPMFPWAVDREADDFTDLHASTLVVALFILKVTKHSITKTTPTLREIYTNTHIHTHAMKTCRLLKPKVGQYI